MAINDMAPSVQTTIKRSIRVLPACQAEKSEYDGKDGILQSQEVNLSSNDFYNNVTRK